MEFSKWDVDNQNITILYLHDVLWESSNHNASDFSSFYFQNFWNHEIFVTGNRVHVTDLAALNEVLGVTTCSNNSGGSCLDAIIVCWTAMKIKFKFGVQFCLSGLETCILKSACSAVKPWAARFPLSCLQKNYSMLSSRLCWHLYNIFRLQSWGLEQFWNAYLYFYLHVVRLQCAAQHVQVQWQ